MIWDGKQPYPCCSVDDSMVLTHPWNEQQWNEQQWNEQQWNEQQWNEQQWNEQQWGTPELLPWWFRTSWGYAVPWGYAGRGWFTEAYPVLSPYYPIWTADPEWVDAWSMQPYQGLW